MIIITENGNLPQPFADIYKSLLPSIEDVPLSICYLFYLFVQLFINWMYFPALDTIIDKQNAISK